MTSKLIRYRCFLAATAGATFFLSLGGTGIAQMVSPASQNPNAVQIVTQALNAMGGAAPWSQLSNSIVTGACTSPAALGGSSANFRWTTQATEFRYETDTNNQGPIYFSAHGKPYVNASTGSVTLSAEYQGRMLPLHLPGVVLQAALKDPAFEIAFVGQEPLNGGSVNHVRIVEFRAHTRVMGSLQDWWFDANSSLPVRASYLLPTQTDAQYGHMMWDFASWSQEGFLVLPHQLLQSIQNEMVLQYCSVQTVQQNANLPSSLFDGR